MSRITSYGWRTNHISRKINYLFHASRKNKWPIHVSGKYPLAACIYYEFWSSCIMMLIILRIWLFSEYLSTFQDSVCQNCMDFSRCIFRCRWNPHTFPVILSCAITWPQAPRTKSFSLPASVGAAWSDRECSKKRRTTDDGRRAGRQRDRTSGGGGGGRVHDSLSGERTTGETQWQRNPWRRTNENTTTLSEGSGQDERHRRERPE